MKQKRPKVAPAKVKGRVALDVGPMFDAQWTGIPIFTRRLAQALLRHDKIDVDFVHNLTTIPEAKVISAIQMGTGIFLQDDFQKNSYAGHDGYGTIDPERAILFPSVKESFQVCAREASIVHDLGTLFMPENAEEVTVSHHMKNMARELAGNQMTFCVSEATRSALVTAYPSSAPKTEVIYQYVDWPEEFEAIERNLQVPRLGPYAVVVGTLEPRKNLGLILNALGTPQIQKSGLKFVVIGKKGWKIDQFLAEVTDEQRERIIFTGFVSEFVKYRLLRHAEFMVYPSVYEGFGIPAVEAMSLGKPVLASMTSSLPEVIGDAGMYFDPLSVTEFADKYAEISNKRRLRELSAKARASAAQFNWQRMAEPVYQWARG